MLHEGADLEGIGCSWHFLRVQAVHRHVEDGVHHPIVCLGAARMQRAPQAGCNSGPSITAQRQPSRGYKSGGWPGMNFPLYG